MSGGLLHLAPYLASMHAMLLSTVNLYPGAPGPGSAPWDTGALQIPCGSGNI
jgi:hypothetical protein